MRKIDKTLKELKLRSRHLYDQAGFRERLLMPVNDLLPHDAAGITGVQGVGFDPKMIHYGYPPQLLNNWLNHVPEEARRLQRYFMEGPKKGYITFTTHELMNDFKGSDEYQRFYQAYDQKDVIQTMFFDAMGQKMGIYACNRFSEQEPYTAEEKNRFHTIAPFIFHALRKYRWLLNIDFFNTESIEHLIFGIITTDPTGRISWLNDAARQAMEQNHDTIPKRLPKALQAVCDRLDKNPGNGEQRCQLFREIETPTPYGSIVTFRFDEHGSKYLPVEGAVAREGNLIVIDTSRLNREIIATLSKRELEVARYIAKGLPDKAISEALSISEKTIQTYTYKLFRKLGVSNRTEAAVKAVRLGIV